ncbi:MAG: hypothetical protein HY553_03180 [Elusimicrobia bacterium]|nr:hypothetical protein [Elusimicrobiota bacterium]
MRKSWAVLALVLVAAAAGCRHIPYLKKWAKKPYYPYLGSKMYSFEYPRKWGDPITLDHGVELRSPQGTGSFSIQFIPKAHKDYKPPEKYRREMGTWGSVEDSHIVKQVVFSSRTAYNVIFTHYEYDHRYMVGQQLNVQRVDHTAIPDPRGMFVHVFRAPREHWNDRRLRKEYRRWLGTLVLSAPPEQR